MGVLAWILFGLIAGVLAKWIMPGKDPGGIIVTILIGIGGAFVGGWLGSMVGMGSMGDFSLGSFVTAILGALVLLGAYRMISK
ncbi:GlsB/YeaQ/YmgE family stress response membrane protein [Halomonas sp. KAO]|uniref:GlsB/YeaQ/YmgE family stress response membrane protein n=1 Tax=unclassified Halomonas TaxID=2609666 RepID=UPI0018A03FCF|nr:MULTISPECIES: GlsB/YeaQ/YmgE family stress response membrane protein [unclassified Halomonas]MBF7053271.1 GlsB/YeaQ/YmgE family stress response membrane protein [Halomonas sp. KAO]MDT0501008.1 GlsB/YeaQ/YmgE family stress response membrane protein [Halomonas sp. PAR7]MDT0593032.1 GlsB/YeaQ/YmgE family stress response membrane protein [Halomonas sp. PAR8]